MKIQPLNFVIADMYGLITNCKIEPFVRVFSMTDQNEAEITAMLNKEWETESDDRLRMRTASFGHHQGRLDMCIYTSNITESDLVPMAIIAAYRQTLYETNKRGFGCGS